MNEPSMEHIAVLPKMSNKSNVKPTLIMVENEMTNSSLGGEDDKPIFNQSPPARDLKSRGSSVPKDIKSNRNMLIKQVADAKRELTEQVNILESTE